MARVLNNKAPVRAPEVIALRQEGVRDQVRSMIHRGELQPGERVNEQALAQLLGVGRNAAREALRSLEQAGLVRIVPNRGAEVRRLSLEDALDLYDIRAGLARTTGRLVALRLTRDEELSLGSLIDAMEQAVTERDAERYHSLNTDFHSQLILATKNLRLVEVNHAIEDELKLYLRKGMFSLTQMQVSNREHRAIFEALRNGNSSLAAEVLEAHVLTGKQRMLDTVSTNGRNPERGG